MKILMNRYAKYLLNIIPLLIALIFIALFFYMNGELKNLTDKYNKSIKISGKEKSELILQNKKLKELIAGKKRMSENVIFLNSLDIEKIKKKGLLNPVQDIISNLVKHRELIPYKGVLGGTMGFYSRKNIWLLTNKWALAYFEDGHIGGYLLLEYNISNNGDIKWKRISSMRN